MTTDKKRLAEKTHLRQKNTHLLHLLLGVFDEIVAFGHSFIERLVLVLVKFNLKVEERRENRTASSFALSK